MVVESQHGEEDLSAPQSLKFLFQIREFVRHIHIGPLIGVIGSTQFNMDLCILQLSTHNKLCPFINNIWSSLKSLATWKYIVGGSVLIEMVSLLQVENDAIVALTLKDDGNYVASNTYSQVAVTVLNHLPVTIEFFLVLNCSLALIS